jgi:TonB-dependent SusC/RagA subfamily outer membrane receptor
MTRKKTMPISAFIAKTLFVFLVSFFVLPIYGQTESTISLRLEKSTLVEFFKAVEKNSDLRFSYINQDIDNLNDVSVIATNENVEILIKRVLSNKGYTYKRTGNTIAVLKTTKNNTSPSKKITGLVTDEKGEPIIGASIVLKGSNTGTITDINGAFSLEVLDQSSITVSYIGYKQSLIKVSTLNNYKIVLAEDNKALDEVVVVGYGTQKKVNLTGSVATVNADKLTIAPLASTTGTLAGRIPGLITKQESGLPGADGTRLSIRGFGAPLVIVDGIETGFNNIDAKEIESISVLKDAAAAIYGARAGDGVILVTTKRGKSDKPIITFNTSTTLQGVTRLPIMASSGQMAELSREEHTNLGKPESNQRFTKD